MIQNIVVLEAEEVIGNREALKLRTGGAAYYLGEALSIMRLLWKKFGLSTEWKQAKVVILVTHLCGCCNGHMVVKAAANKLRSEGFNGYVLGRTVGDERIPDRGHVPWLEWSLNETSEKMIERAEELARRPDQP